MRRDGQQLRGWGKEEEYTSWGSISEYVVTPPPIHFYSLASRLQTCGESSCGEFDDQIKRQPGALGSSQLSNTMSRAVQ